MAAAIVVGAIALVAGATSSIMGGRAKKRAARRAAAEARRIREWYEGRARETRLALGREIQTMRSLRDMDMPNYQEAAEIASVQRAKGYERQTRMREIGKLPQAYRDAVFGGQLQQYIGREGQKIQRYAKMSQGIFGMATQMQTQVNDLLRAGGADYGQMMKSAQAMEYEAGSPIGQALGALGQGLSLASQGMAASKNQEALMTAQQEQSFANQALFGDLSPLELQSRANIFGGTSAAAIGNFFAGNNTSASGSKGGSRLGASTTSTTSTTSDPTQSMTAAELDEWYRRQTAMFVRYR